MIQLFSPFRIQVGKFFKSTRQVFDFFASNRRCITSIYLKLIYVYYFSQWHVYC